MSMSTVESYEATSVAVVYDRPLQDEKINMKTLSFSVECRCKDFDVLIYLCTHSVTYLLNRASSRVTYEPEWS